MKIPFLKPAGPPHVFCLLAEGVTYARVRREPPAFEESRHFRYPSGSLGAGATGTPLFTREAVAEAIKAARALSGGRLTRASVLFPDAWARMLPVELETLPSDPAAARDMVLWKLKKLLPGVHAELSVVFEPIRVEGPERRLLVAAAPRETLESIETAFEQAEVRVGFLSPSSLALFAGLAPLLAEAAAGDYALLHRSSGALSFFIARGAVPIFFRQRPADGDEDHDREARLSLSYYAERLKGPGLKAVYVHDEDRGGGLEKIAAFPVPPVRLDERLLAAEPGFDESIAARPELLAGFAAVYGMP